MIAVIIAHNAFGVRFPLAGRRVIFIGIINRNRIILCTNGAVVWRPLHAGHHSCLLVIDGVETERDIVIIANLTNKPSFHVIDVTHAVFHYKFALVRVRVEVAD